MEDITLADIGMGIVIIAIGFGCLWALYEYIMTYANDDSDYEL